MSLVGLIDCGARCVYEGNRTFAVSLGKGKRGERK
jgi:hypothetical protein